VIWLLAQGWKQIAYLSHRGKTAITRTGDGCFDSSENRMDSKPERERGENRSCQWQVRAAKAEEAKPQGQKTYSGSQIVRVCFLNLFSAKTRLCLQGEILYVVVFLNIDVYFGSDRWYLCTWWWDSAHNIARSIFASKQSLPKSMAGVN